MYHDDRHKLVNYHGLDYRELYDLERDPQELTNLWEEPSAAALRAEFAQKELRRHGSHATPAPPRSAASEAWADSLMDSRTMSVAFKQVTFQDSPAGWRASAIRSPRGGSTQRGFEQV